MIVSDHGAGPLSGAVNLNAWLAREGYLTYLPVAAGLARRLGDTAFGLRRHLPRRLRFDLKQRLPRLRERVYSRKEYSAIDWGRTQAFAYGLFGNVVINVRGREAQGVVEPGAEYERVREELAERALELRGPAGERLVASVHRREDLFDGPELEKLPDLVVEFEDYAWLGKGNLKSRGTSLWDHVQIPDSSHSYVGTHRRDGIFILSGECANARSGISASLVDVAPTILYLLGEPVPTTLEGRTLTEAIDESLLERRPPEFDDSGLAQFVPGEPRSAPGDDVEDRLRALGYIE
jgi:predicted AlkP superfamily phosphohydrolase/phosphomutase